MTDSNDGDILHSNFTRFLMSLTVQIKEQTLTQKKAARECESTHGTSETNTAFTHINMINAARVM